MHLLDLCLIELCRIKRRSSHVGEHWRLSGIVRNFEIAVVPAGEQYQSAGVIENVGGISKHFVLIGVVVDRVGGARGILDPDAVVQVIRGVVVIQLPGHTAVLNAWHYRVEASAIDRCFALLENGAVLCVDIDHAGRAKSELCGQSASNERNAVREAGLQFQAETGNTFRHEHVVDAVLQIRVFAADMKLRERILRDTGKTQHRLVKRSVFAKRLGIETVRSDCVARRAETRHNCLTRDVHLLTLDDDALGFCRARG